MNSYDFLAGCYDEFTADVGYSAWADLFRGPFPPPGTAWQHGTGSGLRHRFSHAGAGPAGL
ncbi:MAG: hypothetical protein V8R75_15285 [Oscillospiraceae bacterium]